MERPLTTDEVTEWLGYHPNHLRRLLRYGKVRGERFNQTWLTDPPEVERIKSLQGPGGRLPKRVPEQ